MELATEALAEDLMARKEMKTIFLCRMLVATTATITETMSVETSAGSVEVTSDTKALGKETEGEQTKN